MGEESGKSGYESERGRKTEKVIVKYDRERCEGCSRYSAYGMWEIETNGGLGQGWPTVNSCEKGEGKGGEEEERKLLLLVFLWSTEKKEKLFQSLHSYVIRDGTSFEMFVIFFGCDLRSDKNQNFQKCLKLFELFFTHF